MDVLNFFFFFFFANRPSTAWLCDKSGAHILVVYGLITELRKITNNLNPLSSKRLLLLAPSLFWVATTKVRFLGTWVGVWVGGSVANVKPPQAVLPTKNLTLTLLPASPTGLFLDLSVQTPLASYGRKRGGRQWRLTELNGLITELKK